MIISKRVQVLIVSLAVFLTLLGFWIFWGPKQKPVIAPTPAVTESNQSKDSGKTVEVEAALPETTGDIDSILVSVEGQLIQEESFYEEEAGDIIEQTDLDDFDQSLDENE